MRRPGRSTSLEGTDTTKHKQAAEMLLESEEKYRSLFENMIDGYAYCRMLYENGVPWDFVYLDVNGAFERLTRLKGVIGKKVSEVIPEIQQSNPELFQTYGRVALTGKPERFETYVEALGIWFLISVYSPRKDHFTAVFEDITARKRAEESLRQSQMRLIEAQRLAKLGDWEWDHNRDCVIWSPEMYDVFGRSREFPPPSREELSRYYTPEGWTLLEQAIEKTRDTGESYEIELEHVREDGAHRWHLAHGEVVRDSVGRMIKLRGIAQDITERKQAEEALKEANATLEKKVEERTRELAQRAAQLRALTGELTLAEQRERSRLANVLHDHIQQMLVAAKFRLTVLGRGGDDVVKQATKEVEELIDESILASRSLTAELIPPILQEAGLKEGLQWLARRMADTQGLSVDLELNESGPLPEDLKILLFQSVRELLHNVVKHANTQSAVINLRRFDGSLQVTVSDQGSGFDPATMPLAGEGGRGFGLLGIQERLRYMGGTLEIESNPGQGSRFVLSVPIVPAAIEPILQETLVSAEAHLMAPQYTDPRCKIRVMLADDHAIFRQGITNLLEHEPDIEVIGEVADGQEAVDLAAKILPDVILMDVSMPKLNGIEATRIIHNDWPEILIIGLSMFEEEDISRAIRDAGAVDYVTKSGSAKVLINVIRTTIRSQKQK